MKNLIASLTLIASIAFADPVPLVLRSTGYSELIKPQAISYKPSVTNEPIVFDGESLATNRVVTPAMIEIAATYQLTAGAPVVDITLDGIRTVIAAQTYPVFNLTITLPVAQFLSYYQGDGAALIAAMQQAGTITPNEALTGLIRAVAVQVIGGQQ